MMEMQDTINALQREIALIRGATTGQKPQPINTPPPDSPVMFTRLDSDRNAKVMKKAVNEKRLSVSKYQVSQIVKFYFFNISTVKCI